MQLLKLLHNLFKKQLPCIHKTRLSNLLTASQTAIRSNKLYLTGLGRELNNKNKESSNIQKMDRLLGNTHLQKEKNVYYKAMLSYLIQKNSTPWIHIDWACINSVTNLYLLRASLSMKGRSIVIYEECYPKKNENNHPTHKAFLNQLKEMLPESVKPVIVTDAGFRGPWFKHILELGWDFVGRLRNKNAIKFSTASDWHLSKSLYQDATSKATWLGEGLLTLKLKVPAYFVLYKGHGGNRHKLKQNKQRSNSSKSNRYSATHKEPWLLATSLNDKANIALKIVNIYAQRMRIEENIRDTKCPYYGLGLKKSLSKSNGRLNILLLIAAIATFAAWLAGIEASLRGKASDFQAHSAKFTSVLSMVFLGRRVLKKGLRITKSQFDTALALLYQKSQETLWESLP